MTSVELPALPAGYKWHVGYNTHCNIPEVTARIKRFGMTRAKGYSFPSDPEDVPASVRGAVDMAYRRSQLTKHVAKLQIARTLGGVE